MMTNVPVVCKNKWLWVEDFVRMADTRGWIRVKFKLYEGRHYRPWAINWLASARWGDLSVIDRIHGTHYQYGWLRLWIDHATKSHRFLLFDDERVVYWTGVYVRRLHALIDPTSEEDMCAFDAKTQEYYCTGSDAPRLTSGESLCISVRWTRQPSPCSS